MKNFLKMFAVVAVAGFAMSCVSRQTAREIESQRDSLSSVVASKDALLNTIFADINAIAENLAEIKTRENLISVVDAETENKTSVERIGDDIAAIDRLLQENGEKLASLQKSAAQLRRANIRIAELDKTIKSLSEQLETKSRDIDNLRAELERRGVEVAELTAEVEARTAEVEARTAEVENLNNENRRLAGQLNAVYYIVGSERELRNAQIIDRQGRIKSGEESVFNCFLQADARLVTEIPVGQKRVSLLTTHPENSYRMEYDGKIVSRLVITDPVRFWESSKILVVSYK